MGIFLKHFHGFLVLAFRIFLIYNLFVMCVGPTHNSVALGQRTPSTLDFPYQLQTSIKTGILQCDSASDVSDESRAGSIYSSEGQDDSATDITEEDRTSSDEDRKIQGESSAGVPRVGFLDLPTEMLQGIFWELPTLDAARAITETSRAIYHAFKGYEKKIILNILSRELGPIRPATLGALAIFVSPRKGPVDEPLFQNLAISARYWEPMLRETAELAKKLLTLDMADQMLAVYRQFPKKIGYRQEERSPHNWCSACTSNVLDEPNSNPRSERTNDNCIDHLLQANAVRYRLNCRMVLGYVAPNEAPKDDHDMESNWDTSRIIGNIMQKVSSKSDDESDSGDEFGSDDQSISDNESIIQDDLNLEDLSPENDSGYESMSDQEDVIHPEDKIYPEDNIYPVYKMNVYPENGNKIYPEYKIYPEDEVYVIDGIYEEDGICQKYRLLQLDELYQQNELHSELYQNDFELWMESDEALSLLDKSQ